MTLAEIFSAHGYKTLGLTANPWIRNEYGYGQGFEKFEMVMDDVSITDGKKINLRFRQHLKGAFRNKPFFAYLHYMDTHSPYYIRNSGGNPFPMKLFSGPINPISKQRCLYTPAKKSDLGYVVALYDEGINRVDGLIKDILDALDEAGVLDNTLLVITPDHGEEFFDHQAYGHGYSLYAEACNTFAILYGPTRFVPKKIEDKIRTIDLFPTMLGLAGITSKDNNIDGRSLLPVIDKKGQKPKIEFIFSELGDKKAIFKDGWKYIYDPFLKTEELFDEVGDIKETVNIADNGYRLRNKMKEILLKECIEKAGIAVLNQMRRISKEERIRLESLGYVSGKGLSRNTSDIRALMMPISTNIDFAGQDFNPRQLSAGWKKEGAEEGGAFYSVGGSRKDIE